MTDEIFEPLAETPTEATTPEPAAAAQPSIWRERAYCLILAALYVFGSGVLTVPRGIMMALISTAVLVMIRDVRLRDGVVGKSELYLTLLATINGFWFAFTSNAYMTALNWLVFLTVVAVLLVSRSAGQSFPLQIGTFILGLIGWIGQSVALLFNPRLFLLFFSNLTLKRGPAIKGLTPASLLVTLGVLAVFHLLFSSINAEYSRFIDLVLEQLWQFLQYIVNIEFIVDCIWVAAVGYVLFGFLAGSERHGSERTLEPTFSESAHLVLGATIILFFVFFSFQSKLLLLNPSALEFKALSLYTQRGFWELLIVAFLGYVLLLFCIWQRPPAEETTKTWRNMLVVFNLELISISLFCAHKLGILQAYFGMKDQRVLASTAVVLILLTFAATLFRILGRMSDLKILNYQTFGLIGAVLFLNVINIDLMITRLSPTSYYVEGVRSPDYSYLLTNSSDNYSAWIELMDQARTSGIKTPTDYYWGRYTALCHSFVPARKALTERYNNMFGSPTLKTIGQLNFREWMAYRLLRDNAEEFDEFSKRFVEGECKNNAREESPRRSKGYYR